MKPDPTPLLRPRSVAVVGASEREGSYGDNILRNISVAGFEGDVWGINPKRDRVHGQPCVPSVGDLPGPVDAVVVAIPAAGVAAVLTEAIERGCGGAIVLSAGFGEIEAGRELERELTAIALDGGLPVCGPNCNGVVSVGSRSPLWGDSVERLQDGGVALISQSGNIAVNALGMRRGIGFHTVVSTGNQAVVSAADWIEAVSALEGVRSIALFLEEDGDGADLARALADCAEREIGVAVLKVGSSEAGARAAGAHTGAVAGDQRVFSALLEEAGAATARDPQELLELARCLAQAPRRRAGGGVAVLTCSGGDSGLAADLAEREGLPLPELAPETRRPSPSCCPRRRRSAIPSTTPRCCGTSPSGSRGSPRRSARTRGSASCSSSSTSRRGCPPPPGPDGIRCAAPSSPGPSAPAPTPSSPRPSPTCCPSGAPSSSPSTGSRRWPV